MGPILYWQNVFAIFRQFTLISCPFLAKRNAKQMDMSENGVNEKKNGRKNISTWSSASSGTFFSKKMAMWAMYFWALGVGVGGNFAEYSFSRNSIWFSQNENIISIIFSTFLVDNGVCFWFQKIPQNSVFPLENQIRTREKKRKYFAFEKKNAREKVWSFFDFLGQIIKCDFDPKRSPPLGSIVFWKRAYKIEHFLQSCVIR